MHSCWKLGYNVHGHVENKGITIQRIDLAYSFEYTSTIDVTNVTLISK